MVRTVPRHGNNDEALGDAAYSNANWFRLIAARNVDYQDCPSDCWMRTATKRRTIPCYCSSHATTRFLFFDDSSVAYRSSTHDHAGTVYVTAQQSQPARCSSSHPMQDHPVLLQQSRRNPLVVLHCIGYTLQHVPYRTDYDLFCFVSLHRSFETRQWWLSRAENNSSSTVLSTIKDRDW